MTPEELAAVRERLEEFAAEVFAPLSRSDQRDKGQTYLRGLLLDGRRKSMQPMAERLGVDHQGLQQFVSSSTWAVEPVRERLARRAVEVIAPDAWVVDDTGFPKDGAASPGVARQYSGTTGKIHNCQIGGFLAYATPAGRALIDREPYLPRAWTDDRERARAAGIGEDVGFATKPELARRMLTRALDAGVPVGWLTADEIYGQDKRLRVWCEQYRLPYVLATRSNDTVATVDWRQRRVRTLIAELPT